MDAMRVAAEALGLQGVTTRDANDWETAQGYSRIGIGEGLIVIEGLLADPVIVGISTGGIAYARLD